MGSVFTATWDTPLLRLPPHCISCNTALCCSLFAAYCQLPVAMTPRLTILHLDARVVLRDELYQLELRFQRCDDLDTHVLYLFGELNLAHRRPAQLQFQHVDERLQVRHLARQPDDPALDDLSFFRQELVGRLRAEPASLNALGVVDHLLGHLLLR